MTIGQTLAAAREGAGLTLADLSARTCIRRPVLSGIEADDFRLCGGDFYARGHIRTLCRELGVDPAESIERFDREHAHEHTVPAFTGKPVTAGMHESESRESGADGGDSEAGRGTAKKRGADIGDSADSGSRDTAEQRGAGSAPPPQRSAERARPTHAAAGPRRHTGEDPPRRGDAEKTPARRGDAAKKPAGRGSPVPEARRPDPAADAAPADGARRGKHGRSAPDESRGAGAAESGSGAGTGAGTGADRSRAGDAAERRSAGRVPAQRRERKTSLLAATIAAARRSWPLAVIAVLAGAAVVAAAVSWPDGSSDQRAGIGGIFQREAPADVAPPPESPHPTKPAGQQEEPGGGEQQASPAPESSFGAGLSGVATGDRKAEAVRLTVSATERVWLSVTDAQGETRFTGVLKKGDVRAWADPDELRLHVGTSSAVRVTVNGDHRGTPAETDRVAHFTYSAADLA